MSLGLGKYSIQHHRDLSISFLKMTVTCCMPDAYAPLQLLLKHQCFSVLHKLCRWWQDFPWGESGCSAALTSLTQTQNSNIIGFYNLLTGHRCRFWQWMFTGVFFKGDKCFETRVHVISIALCENRNLCHALLGTYCTCSATIKGHNQTSGKTSTLTGMNDKYMKTP